MKYILQLGFAILALFVASCSNTDYINAIPSDSQLLLSVDPLSKSGAGSVLKVIPNLELKSNGIDLGQRVFMFVDGQGNIGVCARVADADALTKALSGKNISTIERQGAHFGLIGSWMISYNDNSLLLMGPVVPAAQMEMTRLMARYLKQEEDESITSTDLFARLDSIDGDMTMVTQVAALPQQLTPALMLGTTIDAAPSDVYVAARLKVNDGVLWVDGTTYSPRKKINDALTASQSTLRPIEGRYVPTMGTNDAVGLFVNADGKKFINLMHQNKGITAMLMALNSAVDMDNIIRDVNGDMAIVSPNIGKGDFRMRMCAQMPKADWLNHVSEWQANSTDGKISTWGPQRYYYTSPKTTYYFGLTPDGQYISGGSADEAEQSIKPSAQRLSQATVDAIKGKRMAMVVNIDALAGGTGAGQAITGMLHPIFGKVSSVLITRK